MTNSLRTRAPQPPPVRSAVARDTDPSTALARHFSQVLAKQRGELPLINPALEVAAVGFVRHQGDWLGVVITPWFLDLFLLSGSGQIWGDIPTGERRYVDLPCGTLHFIAEDDPDLGPYQHFPLITPIIGVPDMASAVQIAQDAMRTVLVLPALPTTSSPEPFPGNSRPGTPPTPLPRRTFFRRLAGKR